MAQLFEEMTVKINPDLTDFLKGIEEAKRALMTTELKALIAEEVRKQLKELAQIRVEMGAHPLPSAKKDT